MRIGIVGCGIISRHHLAAVSRYPGFTVVGLADCNVELAREQASRYSVPRAFDNLSDLLELRPEVVHVLTPPDSHELLACQALAAGAHVYVEKPMALSEAACDNMKAAALRAKRELCVGQSMLYMPAVLRARELLESGVAGEIVHAAAGFNYDVRRNPNFRGGHWAKALPGGLAEDLAVHPASLLVNLLGAPRRILALSRAARELSGGSPGAADATSVIPDDKPAEAVAAIDAERGLGMLSVSLRTRPDMALLDISCTRMMMRLNIASMALTIYRDRRVPRAIGRAFANIDAAAQLLGGTLRASWQLARGKVDGSWGIVPLVHAFYGALERGDPAPVSPDEGRRLVGVLRAIWPLPGAVPNKAAA